MATVGGLAIGLGFRSSSNDTVRAAASVVLSLVPTGILLIALMATYVKVEKFRHWDRLLNMVRWRGDERVLDVGTGRGLLAIGAAKRLTTGKSIGIDIWREQDLSGNTTEAAMRNGACEGVAERIEFRNADAREMPFPDGAFDCVLSNLCLHNIPSREGRAAACREIARVLKAGGVALVSDFRYTDEYASAFRERGLETSVAVSFLVAPMFLRIVKASKR